MSASSVTCRRMISRAFGLFTTAFGYALFLAVSAVFFAVRLEGAEGSRQLLATIWSTSVAPALPLLAIFFAMDGWCEERRSGRIDILLSTGVSEKDIVFGKALGVFLLTGAGVIASLLLTVVALAFSASNVLAGVTVVSWLPALTILLLQAALWSALACAVSAFFVRAFASVATSIALLVAFPRGLWQLALRWAPQGRPAFGEMCFDAHVGDFSSGLVQLSVLVFYVVFTALALFITTETIIRLRLVGRSAGRARFISRLSSFLAIIAAVATVTFVYRTDLTMELPLSRETTFPPELVNILRESSGKVSVTAFLSRKDSRFRSVAQTLRRLKALSASIGGLEVTLSFVDPSWDFGAAERLVRLGAEENSLVLEKGRRTAFLPLADAADAASVISAVRRVTLPPQRRDVYWTVGHGEIAFDEYDAWGMSDVARELSRNGYRNVKLELTGDRAIPSDCALIVVADAKEAFSRGELSRLDAYLKAGGRMLVLQGPPGEGGVAALLPSWGVRSQSRAWQGAPTMSGTDVLVSEFGSHPVATALEGSRLIFENPLTFVSSAAAISGSAADRIDFVSVARIGEDSVVVAIERGGVVGDDLGLRPTRLVVIGDPSFVQNGQLAARANANRKLFQNAVAYLAGVEVSRLASAGVGDVLVFASDRDSRRRFVIGSAGVIPILVLILVSLVVYRRRAA